MVGFTDCNKKEVKLLEEWLKTQHHLPQSIHKMLLSRFVDASNGDLEYAKKLIDLNYTMRNNYPQIFLKRDPCDDGAQKILEVIDIILLPNLTPERYKVLFSRLSDIDPNKFDLYEVIKMFIMFADVRFTTQDPAGISHGEVSVLDLKGLSLKHLTRVPLSTLRTYMRFTQEALPVRLKAVHLLNCPSYLDKVMMVIKPFLKGEVSKLLHFHLPESETLYEHIPKEMLPYEYGGQGGGIKDIKSQWVRLLKENRDYLTNEIYWKIDEKKRVKSKSKEVVNDSFKSLSID